MNAQTILEVLEENLKMQERCVEMLLAEWHDLNMELQILAQQIEIRRDLCDDLRQLMNEYRMTGGPEKGVS